MAEERTTRTGVEVRALKMVLYVLLAIYGALSAGSVLFVLRVFPSVIKTPSGTSFGSLAEMTRVIFDRVVPGLIYFFIGWCIFRLIALISRREPFSSASPLYIRRIGWAVLVLAAGSMLVYVVQAFKWPVGVLSKTFISAVCDVLSTLLLGLGFLVIAKVLEAGVRLQQDQNLTV